MGGRWGRGCWVVCVCRGGEGTLGGVPPSVLEPRVRGDGSFAAVAVVVQQLLALVDVPGRHEDEVRDAVDVVQFGLAVPALAVVDQPAHPAALFGGVHAARREKGLCNPGTGGRK